MLNEFVEKILVHERDRKGSIQTTQEVEIYFNFVGRFVPPAFGEAELTSRRRTAHRHLRPTAAEKKNDEREHIIYASQETVGQHFLFLTG